MICLIPARGGSKRFPRKNIAPFEGRPLVAWPIRTACEAGIFARVVVSTEDPEIAAVARRWGAEVDDRPIHLATDTAQVVDVCLDFLSRNDTDVLCCIYATACLLTPGDVRAAVGMLGETVVGVSRGNRHAWQAMREDGEHLTAMWPDLIHKRSQDMPDLWFSNGTIYAAKADVLKRQRSFYGPNVKGYHMPLAVDIDRPEDLELASFYHRRVYAAEERKTA